MDFLRNGGQSADNLRLSFTQGPTNCMSRYPGDTKKCGRATRYFAWVFRRDTRPGTAASVDITAIAALSQTTDRVMFRQVQ